MNITFYGAAHEVTGSCHLLDTGKKKILIDCGMFQGSDFSEGRNHDNFPFDPSSINVVVVTHAHLDHIGRLPKLVRDGFAGRIYMTGATVELARIVWEDALEVMKNDHKKFDMPLLYDESDIGAASILCSEAEYYKKVDLGERVKFVFKDAGHIFGSAFVEVSTGGQTIAFSGDIGNANMPILRDTDQLGKIDLLLCESTYGDRVHEPVEEARKILIKLIEEGSKKGGTIMVPAFSIERTQEFIYSLHLMSEERLLPDFPIFVDSPMAIKAISVYKKYPKYYDADAAKRYKIGDDFLSLTNLQFTETVSESKRINQIRGPKMVIAGAGMMNGGRILHHASRYLSDPNSTLLIIGYQSQGTLGRKLYEGAERVMLFGQEIQVRCAVKAIGGLSAHGDQLKLFSWVRGAEKMPERVYCVHGEAAAATTLATKFKNELRLSSFIPEFAEKIDV